MPLILPSQRVIRPNPLAYPAGAVPGFDPSHIAAGKACYLSAVVASGPNAINLGPIKPGPLAVMNAGTAPIAVIDSYTGPAISCPTGTVSRGIDYTGAANIKGGTVAVIVDVTNTNSAAYGTLISNSGSSQGLWLKTITSNVSFSVAFYSATTSIDPLPGSLPLGPYFIAASLISGQQFNFVFKNLATGVVTTAVSATAGTDFSFAKVCFGNDTSNDFASVPIAAGMFSDANLSISKLLQWARSPWEFWYPNKTTNLVNSAGAAATFLAAWARGSNLPVIGTGNY